MAYTHSILKATLISILTLTLLGGCRYLELYRFSEQFCAFDDHILITPSNTGTKVSFNLPVLKRSLLLRYLGATPFSSQDNMAYDLFILTNTEAKLDEPFSLHLNYHLLDDYKLLESGQLDTRLSAAFPPDLIKNILLSFCTDDYDLGTQRVVFRFKVDTKEPGLLPTRKLIQETFGNSSYQSDKPNFDRLRYQLAFVDKSDKVQKNKISLDFEFDQLAILSHIHIQYYKYDYQLDLTNGQGRLIINRNK